MARWGNCDFRELREMADRFHAAEAAHKSEQMSREVLQELGNMLLRATKDATPKSKQRTSGHLKRNWFLGDIRRYGNIFTIEIYNNVEYAPWVENGHRIVRNGQTIGYVNGKYMLRISLAELEHKAPSIYSRRALDLLRQLIGGSS